MSHETVRNFFQSLETDELLQEQVKNANNSAKVIQIASEKGYEFTAEELQEYMQETTANEELKLEELEAVSGGNNNNNNNNESLE
jgi:predicted ribosomally synthesized peptide with nif11-like leader